MPHPDVLVNVRRALVPLVAIRTLESRLLAAVVLHVGLQGLLVRVARVAPGTVVGHLARLPVGALFVLRIAMVRRVLHVRPEDVHQARVVGGHRATYEQGTQKRMLATAVSEPRGTLRKR